MNYYIDVILPIPIQHVFTYSINKEEAAFLQPGMRVAVPFGKSKIYTSIVFQVHNHAPNGYDTKEIDQILDEQPILTKIQLEHWQWMASYYMCTLGEVLRAGVSRAFLLESETMITLNKEIEIDASSLREDELLVCEALQMQSSLRIQEIQAIIDRKAVLPLVRRLVERKILIVQEEVVEQYKPKIVRFVKLHPNYASEIALKSLLEDLVRAPKQRDVVITLFSISSQTKKPVKVEDLQKRSEASAAIIKSLINKEVLEEFILQKDRINYDGEAPNAIKKLSEHQEIAFKNIKESFKKYPVTLLHGVTSSGKTEIYVKLIEEFIKSGKQVVYMLPEIALTTQLVTRLQYYFGEKISVYHSKYSTNERVEVWQNVLHNKPKAQIIVGARSTLFLPFQNLGLVIVDEEHEPSFKQYAPAPRYHARDSAIVLASLHKAKTLLGSATPSLESYFNAKENKYGLVTLTERFGNVQLPFMELVNLKENYHKKKMNGHFSETLLDAIKVSLNAGEQVILFQNRRGYSPIIECKTCGHSPQCPNCDVSLTYHHNRKQLRCHYCGYHIAMQQDCMACGSADLDAKGLGTEQIETELKALFPDKKIARMDQDTTKGKNAYAKLIDALELGEIDILVGTQMLAKGLDFRNVSLVGVMNADNLLNFPDFRAHERSFQLLLQVAGRAGRTEKQGKVIIQTYNPQHPILQQVVTYNYDAMYEKQLEERFNFNYPPFFRLLKITIKDRKFNTMQLAATWLGQALRSMFPVNILGPEQPPVGRIRNEYITNILVKIPKEQSLQKTKESIRKVERKFLSIKEFRSVKFQIDVDNY
ncbi:MAG: primosomal protein N' [Flavobacteriaceae bacterium CG_4_8_14_3_um_filter_34_10]|nr:MAG: primosomal protein N' [Flavobacteriaceae bacterium CG18_big_fil_WC_8_21_14_2_50_34_36]PIX09435.1 MAG: primosomal protein N' [Flavobacteriaceae bacterium CG_4_8_14_3_um_filter_34_10]PIZ08453.1 MAG: primosomal protein N' [Flavobacteriaceae bacterium CG_4_10_14_0_8_um_filter_34_31]PJC07490.1 MAG: primosomal protein N' [Flavobacteriaceae bacterium CG_4_9_14_0_8_um_filter_34_30]